MSLQAYTQQPCVPCPKCKQDLESVLILQIGIIEDYLVRTSPKSGPQSGGPLENLIPANSDDYLDLSHCYLYLKCPVLKADGSYIETLKAEASQGANSSIGPVNLLLHSLFGQVDLVMNNALVATYPYRAYLTNLLSYGHNGHNAKETWLRRLEGWHTDEAGKYYAQENVGLMIRQAPPATAGFFTSRAGCTRTGCCKSNWCRTTWMSSWCCCLVGPRSTSWTLVASLNLMYASRRSYWKYARSMSPPLNSCTWRRSWPLRGPNTR